MKGESRLENVVAARVKKARLTRAQMKIAEYIIANPELVGRSSSMEVARAAGVSDVSVTRFARAIGYPGFTELKNDIYDSLAAQAAQGVGRLTLDERLEANRARFGSGVSREAFLKVQADNLERTIMQNPEEAYARCADAVVNAKTCFVAGFRGCFGVAQHFAWILEVLMNDVRLIDDVGVGGVDRMQKAGADDCLVFFSASRYYQSDLRLVRVAKAHGAKLCLVTDSVLSPLVPFADVTLTAEVRQMGFFNSATAMNAVCEYLLTLLTPRCLDRYRAHVRERDEITKELLISN
ncbi:MAG: MurR/RpiR family transcriptional regulator [Pyramidobacter sp.]|nr:MurR/RpiR family transcriptional regulator [Pyramidobacter sp.]